MVSPMKFSFQIGWRVGLKNLPLFESPFEPLLLGLQRLRCACANGPSSGPPTGPRSAHQRPSASGSTWLARRDETDPGRPGRCLAVQAAHLAAGRQRPGHQAPPGPAGPARSAAAAGPPASRPAPPGPGRAGPRPAAAAAASRRSCGPSPADRPLGPLDQLVELGVASGRSAPEAVEELGQVAHRRVAEDLPLGRPAAALSRSVRWATSLANSSMNACSASCTASSNRAATRPAPARRAPG